MDEEKNNVKDTQIAPIESYDVFARFDQLDDRAIIAELEGRVLEAWVYHFPQEGKDVWGIAKEGADECVHRMAKDGVAIREEDLTWETDPTNPEFVLFKATVSKYLVSEDGSREAKLDTVIGTKKQWIMMKRRDGHIAQNKFWFEQGSQKAIRNAKLRLIPAEIKAAVIAYAKKHKKVKTLDSLKNQGQSSMQTKQKKTSDSKKKNNPTPKTKVSTEFPKENGELPDDSKLPLDHEKATQAIKMDIIRLQATLVDKYGIPPDDILEKMDEIIGTHIIEGLTIDQADRIKAFFEKTIAHNEAQKKK